MYVKVLMSLLLMKGVTCSSLGSGCCTSYSAAYHGNVTDCQNQNLAHVPSDLPEDIVVLDLQYNLLTSIPNNSFSSFWKLRFLYLSHNPLKTLQMEAFRGLDKLETLEMSCDTLSLDVTTYPDGLFQHLVHLKKLFLNGSINDDAPFPTDIVQGLNSLEELHINSWPKGGKWPQLEQVKNTLKLLNTQTIGVPILRNTTFQALRDIPLNTLFLSGVLTNIEAGTFCPFTNLTKIVMFAFHRSSVKLLSITRALQCFAGRDMEEIILSRVISSGESSVALTDEILSNLADICARKVDLSNNKITSVQTNVIRNNTFFRCIEHLNLAQNMFSWKSMSAFRYIYILGNLKYLGIKKQAYLYVTNITQHEGDGCILHYLPN